MRPYLRPLALQAAISLSIGGTPVVAQVAEIAVERQLARELGLAVGDTVQLGPASDSLTSRGIVAAIYEPRPDPAEIAKRERHARLHLPDLAATLGAPDRVDRFGIDLRPGVLPDTAAAALNELPTLLDRSASVGGVAKILKGVDLVGQPIFCMDGEIQPDEQH